jgi:hypothetical protein
MKRLIPALFLASTLCAPVLAQSTNASEASSMAATSILASPVLSLEGKPLEASAALGLGGVFMVVAVAEGASEAVSLSIRGVEAGSTFIVKASTAAVKGSAVVVGTSLRVVAESTGYALMASGQLLAFIPNAIGQALLYQSPVK